jgi:hypothetical protein
MRICAALFAASRLEEFGLPPAPTSAAATAVAAVIVAMSTTLEL